MRFRFPFETAGSLYIYVYIYIDIYIYICHRFNTYIYTENGKRKIFFLGRQTMNGNRRLLFQQMCPTTYVIQYTVELCDPTTYSIQSCEAPTTLQYRVQSCVASIYPYMIELQYVTSPPIQIFVASPTERAQSCLARLLQYIQQSRLAPPPTVLCCMRNPVDSHSTIMSLYNSS